MPAGRYNPYKKSHNVFLNLSERVMASRQSTFASTFKNK